MAISKYQGRRYFQEPWSSEWIIDSGATDHMTCDPHKFTSFSLDYSKTFIINANGVLSPIDGVGIVCLSPSLSIPYFYLFLH